MTLFKRISFALVDAGRDAQLERAVSISSPSHPTISLDPPTKAQLEHLLNREEAIAAAVDERYKRLDAAVGPDDGLRSVIEEGQTHASNLGPSLHVLGDPLAPGVLRATRREASDSFEQRLLDISDRIYHLIVAMLRDRFVPDSFGSLSQAVSAMFALDDANRALVQRGLLPPFTAA
jgi:hypothetical protein